jgi:RNA polymerase sigma-70 factor, ECF subfamily
MSEAQLIEKIREGDIQAFENVFKELYKVLRNYAYTLVKDYDTADELVQEVFYGYWKHRNKIQISSTLKGYLYQNTKNQCLQYLRHKKVEQKYAERIRLESASYDPPDELVLAEITEKIDRTFRDMPDKTREIFMLSRFDGLKYGEIANRLSISVKTVEAYMGKALRLFREGLGGMIG